MKRIRLHISQDGTVNLHDPNFSIAPVIEALVPNLKVKSEGFGDYLPFFERTRAVTIDCTGEKLKGSKLKELRHIHDQVLKGQNAMFGKTGNATLLDLKIEIADRELEACRLCGNNCGINRYLYEGKCGLRADSHYSSMYVHMGEESLINPALAINLESHCGLDCCFCISKGIAQTSPQVLKLLNESTWYEVQAHRKDAVSIEFAGGSPDNHIANILRFLKKAPQKMLPLVSNCHLYGNPIVYRLFDGIIDVYVADFKFGNDKCAERLAGAQDYVNTALTGLDTIRSRYYKPRIIIRILLLPTHIQCCAEKTLRLLRPYRNEIILNIMDQYVPEYRVLQGSFPELNARVSSNDYNHVRSLAQKHGFTLI